MGVMNIQKQLKLNVKIPTEFFLSQNYPNPFNPGTKIKYSTQKDGFVQLKVYDILGKEVANLVNENKEAGYYSVDFDASQLPSGVYIYNMQGGDFVNSKKMILNQRIVNHFLADDVVRHFILIES